MTYKRGFETVQMIVVVIILGLIGAAAVVAHHWHESELTAARAAGADGERLKWEKREREQQQTYAAELVRLRKESDAELAEFQTRLGTAESAYLATKKDLDHAKLKNDLVERDLRTGRLVLVDPGKGGAPAGQAGGDNRSADSGAEPDGHGATDGRGRLSPGVAQFLWTEAARADAVIGDLEAHLALAQDTIGAYYKLALECRRNE